MSRALVVAVAVLLTLPVLAQDLESLAGLRLRFDAPGARGAAMGGASEALSDPFSAATNPASLARQRTRVAAVETRETTNETPYLTGGTIGAFTSSSFETSARGLRNATLVVPTRNATFALFYDEPLNLSSDTTSLRNSSMDVDVTKLISVGVRGDELVPLDQCVREMQPSPCMVIAYFSTPAVHPARADLRLRRYGAAAARAFGPLSVGASAQYAQLDEDFGGLAPGGQTAKGRELTWNAGLQYDLGSRVRLGGSYRGGARYDAERVILGPPAGTPLVAAATFRTPASYAGGIAAEVTPHLTIAFDAVRVLYGATLENSAQARVDGPVAPILYELPDVTELRAGAEYRLQTRIPIALRAGWWREPAHRVRAVSHDRGIAATMNTVMLLDRDENHITAGVGIGSRVRLDAAFDRSEHTTRASLAVATAF